MDQYDSFIISTECIDIHISSINELDISQFIMYFDCKLNNLDISDVIDHKPFVSMA